MSDPLQFTQYTPSFGFVVLTLCLF
jgi:nucleolin